MLVEKQDGDWLNSYACAYFTSVHTNIFLCLRLLLRLCLSHKCAPALKLVAIAYEKFNYSDLRSQIFVFWKSGCLGGGRLQEVVAQGGSTVLLQECIIA